jgi:type II secretory pathway component PulJ
VSRFRSEEPGFTVVELLISMVIALAVSLATFTLIEVVMRRSGDIAARVDTTQRARTAMDQITRQLRSQVCTQRLGQPGRTIDSASPTSLTVFTDFSDETINGAALNVPDLRQLSFDLTGKTLTETVTTGTRATGSIAVDYSKGTVVNRRILANVVATRFADSPTNVKPIFFRYYRYPAGATDPQPTEEILKATESRALTATELQEVAMIAIDYQVLTSTNETAGATVLQNKIYVRTSTPNDDQAKGACTAY